MVSDFLGCSQEVFSIFCFPQIQGLDRFNIKKHLKKNPNPQTRFSESVMIFHTNTRYWQAGNEIMEFSTTNIGCWQVLVPATEKEQHALGALHYRQGKPQSISVTGWTVQVGISPSQSLYLHHQLIMERER